MLALLRNESLIAPDLRSDDHIPVAFSGGKDSLACLLHLLDAGIDPARIELHHHAVDGRGPPTFGYRLGFGRVCCMNCIFASRDQLATIRWMAPVRFETIAEYERRFGCTVERDAPIHVVTDRGRPYPAALARPDLVALAMSEHWSSTICTSPERGRLPAGAFGDVVGPG